MVTALKTFFFLFKIKNQLYKCLGTQKARVLDVMWYLGWILEQRKGINKKTGEIQIESSLVNRILIMLVS